jgi:hypothetical protein
LVKDRLRTTKLNTENLRYRQAYGIDHPMNRHLPMNMGYGVEPIYIRRGVYNHRLPRNRLVYSLAFCYNRLQTVVLWAITTGLRLPSGSDSPPRLPAVSSYRRLPLSAFFTVKLCSSSSSLLRMTALACVTLYSTESEALDVRFHGVFCCEFSWL